MAGEELRDQVEIELQVVLLNSIEEQTIQTIPIVKPVGNKVVSVSVVSNPSNCEVLVNGQTQGYAKLTPTILTFSHKQILKW